MSFFDVIEPATRQPRRTPYATSTTVLVEDEPTTQLANVRRAHYAAGRQWLDRSQQPTKESSKDLIRSLILSTGLVMAFEPADEVAACTDTITSATPRPLLSVVEEPPVSATATQSDDELVGGVIALRVQRKVLFTKQFDLRSCQLPKRKPQNYTDLDWVPDDDE